MLGNCMLKFLIIIIIISTFLIIHDKVGKIETKLDFFQSIKWEFVLPLGKQTNKYIDFIYH